MTGPLKGILKNKLIPEWKEADEIVKRLWLGTITEIEHARRRNITEIICVSKDPHADLQREGFKKDSDLDITGFKIDSDTEGDLLSIFGEVCDAIDRVLYEGEGVLVWDIGGGLATLAAYIMRNYEISLPEAMTAIARARLKQPKPTLLPRTSIMDLLHNEDYLKQLEMWQACEYDISENVILNPSEPREEWIVESLKGDSEQKRDDELPIFKRVHQRLPLISEEPHRLSTIAEVEEEVRRLSSSTIEEDDHVSTTIIGKDGRISTSNIQEDD